MSDFRGWHLIITFALKGGGRSIKMRTYANRGRGVSHQCERSHIFFLIEYLVHKRVTIVTRFFVSFIKIPVLLKRTILKKLYPVRA